MSRSRAGRSVAFSIAMIFSCAASVFSQERPEPDWKLAEHVLRDPKTPTLLKLAACQVIARAGDKAAGTSSALISVESPRGEPNGGELHRAALQALLKVDRDAIPHLLAAMESFDQVGNSAADMLADTGQNGAAAVDTLRKMMFSTNFNLSRRALIAVKGLGPVAAGLYPEVHRLMADRSWEVRADALRAMLVIARDKREVMEVCVPILVLQSDRTTIAEKISACNELHRLGPRAGLAAYDLAALWRAPEPLGTAARSALRAIGELDLAALEMSGAPPSGHPDAIQQAIWASVNSPTPLPRLIDLLRVPSDSAKLLACDILSRLGPKATDAMPDLHTLLRSRSAEVRYAAIDAMTAIDPSLNRQRLAAAGAILGGAQSDFSRAIQVLDNPTGDAAEISEIAADIANELMNDSVDLRESTRRILLAAPKLDEVTFETLHIVYGRARYEPDHQISNFARLAVLKILVHFDAARIDRQAELEDAFDDPAIGDAAADIIAGAGPSASSLRQYLMGMTANPDPIRQRAVHALSGVAGGDGPIYEVLKGVLSVISGTANEPKPIVQTMTGLLEDPNKDVRIDAAMALGRIGDPAAAAAIPRITKMLDSTNDAEVAGGARALTEFGDQALPALPPAIKALRQRIENSANESEGPAADARAACAELVARLAAGSDEHAQLLLLAVEKKDWVSRERLAPPLAKRERPKDLVANLIELARSSPDSLVRINARCALREIGASLPGDATR